MWIRNILADKRLSNKQAIQSYREVFSTESGKYVLLDLCRLAGLDVCTFNGNPYINAFDEGKRAIVLHLLNMLEIKTANLREGLHIGGITTNGTSDNDRIDYNSDRNTGNSRIDRLFRSR